VSDFPYLLGKRLLSNTYSGGMELGDPAVDDRFERCQLDVAMDGFETALTDVIEKVEAGGLDQLTAEQKVAVWQRVETFRNRLPLIDHNLIADAEATDLPETYCSSTVSRFLVQVLQLSPTEAASRVRAAAATGLRTSMLGEKLEPVLPKLAALQRQGEVSTEKVQIVERAMHKLTRPGLDPEDVETAEQLLTQYAPVLGPVKRPRFCAAFIRAASRA